MSLSKHVSALRVDGGESHGDYVSQCGLSNRPVGSHDMLGEKIFSKPVLNDAGRILNERICK